MPRCDVCRVVFENDAYKYCPLCGKAFTTITVPYFPPTSPWTYPWVGDPPATNPWIVWGSTDNNTFRITQTKADNWTGWLE